MANKIEIVITSRDEASGNIANATNNITSSFAGMAKKIGGIAAGIAAALAVAKLTRAVSGYVGEATLAAARSSELAAVLDLLGARAGWTADQIDYNVDAMKELGIRSDVAQGLLAQFARYQLDAADATSLARVAQDAAVLSMQDSSDALDQIMHGILTQNTRVLRNAGLNIQAAQAMEVYADSAGKTTEQLTETERIQAMMNAVMQEGVRIAGTYDTAMEEPGKRLRSLARHFYEIRVAVGDFFLPAFGNAISIVEKFVKWIRTAVEEGGFLRPALLHLGAAADIVSERFLGLAESAMESGQSIYEDFGGRMVQTAESALTWGINIVTQLASGIIQGAATVLAAAMDYIAAMLSWFLAPGSPPRIAPDIDKWGMAAMNEYLRGFTSASFDILEGVQQPLYSVLQTLVQTGELAADEAAQAFHNIGAELTHAVSEFQRTGKVFENMLGRLGAVGGEFGTQLVELARRQFAVAAATDRMREATERLTQAQEEHVGAQSDTARITDEYNMMLLEGASYEELVAKRAEKTAAERREAQAEEALKAAEVEKSAAEEQMDLERDRLSLQSRLIDQMELLAQTQADMVAEALVPESISGGGAGGKAPKIKTPSMPKGGAGLPEMELPEIGGMGAGIMRGVDEAFEEAKERIKAKWADMFAPVVEAWEEKIQPSLQRLQESWRNFSTTISRFYNAYIQPVVDGIADLIPAETRDGIIETFGKIVGAILAFQAVVLGVNIVLAIAGGVIAAITSPIGLVILAIIALATIWETNFLGIRTAIENAWPVIETIFTSLNDWIVTTLAPVVANFATQWVGFWTDINVALQNSWTIIVTIFQELARWINDNLVPAAEGLARIWTENVWPPIQAALETAWDAILTIWESLLEWLDDTLPGGLEGLQEVWETVMSALSSAVQPVKDLWDDFTGAVRDFWNWITNKEFKFKIKIPDIPDWAIPGSPLPLHTAWKEFARDLSRMNLTPPLAFQDARMTTAPRDREPSPYIYIERLLLENVEDAPDLLRQLQEMTI